MKAQLLAQAEMVGMNSTAASSSTIGGPRENSAGAEAQPAIMAARIYLPEGSPSQVMRRMKNGECGDGEARRDGAVFSGGVFGVPAGNAGAAKDRLGVSGVRLARDAPANGPRLLDFPLRTSGVGLRGFPAGIQATEGDLDPVIHWSDHQGGHFL